MNYPYSSPARTLASSGHSASSPASRSPLPASSAAALAALSRSTGSLSLEDNSKPMYWEKKAWFRLIDDEVRKSLQMSFTALLTPIFSLAHRQIQEIASYRNSRHNNYSRQRRQSFARRF